MQQPQTLSGKLIKTLRENWLYLALLFFLFIFPHLVGWVTGDSPFGVGGRPRGQSITWQNIFIEVFIFSILAMSYNLMFGFTGVISFGHALFFGLGGFALGLVLETSGLDSGTGLLIGALVGIGLSGLIGFIVGLVSLRLKGVYFAIFTLALAEMAFIYAGRWPVTNAEDGIAISNIPALINPTQNRLTYYYIVLIVVVLTFFIIRRLINSPTGRVLLAIRENEERAQAIGYYTLRYKLLAITIASMLASVAGMLHVIMNKKIGPEMLSINFTIEPLIMVIIGGIGTFAGPIIGAAGLQLSERILNRELEIGQMTLNIGESWSLILGIAFIVVVLVFPYGVVGTFQRVSAWIRRRGRSSG